MCYTTELQVLSTHCKLSSAPALSLPVCLPSWARRGQMAGLSFFFFYLISALRDWASCCCMNWYLVPMMLMPCAKGCSVNIFRNCPWDSCQDMLGLMKYTFQWHERVTCLRPLWAWVCLVLIDGFFLKWQLGHVYPRCHLYKRAAYKPHRWREALPENENCLSKLGDIELAEFNKVHQKFSGLWEKEVDEVGRQTSEVCVRCQVAERGPHRDLASEVLAWPDWQPSPVTRIRGLMVCGPGVIRTHLSSFLGAGNWSHTCLLGLHPDLSMGSVLGEQAWT